MLHLPLSLMNRFQNLDSVFPKDPIFIDYLVITTAVVVPCGGPKPYPRTSIQRWYFNIFWSFGTVAFNIYIWEYSIAQPGARRCKRMSHLSISLMYRINKTESAIFKIWMLYFQRVLFQIIEYG